MSNDRKLDQFYTNNDIASHCHQLLLDFMDSKGIEKTVWLEPSAGTGAFYNLLEGEKIGIDLEPKTPNVIESDFLEFDLEDKQYITIGNPPFGKNSSLAIKFFNKCSLHSKVVAFIVPKTFKKDSVKNKLNANMHLEYEYEIPANSFHFINEIVDVPCVFQIWVRKDLLRDRIKKSKITEDFLFVKRGEADVAFQRVGVKAGTIKGKERFDSIADPSHNFIQIVNPESLLILKLIDWNSVKYNTAGNPSISKAELIEEYEKYKEGLIFYIRDGALFFIDKCYKLKVINNDVVISFEKESLSSLIEEVQNKIDGSIIEKINRYMNPD